MISVVLDYPPSSNRYWRVWRGRPVMSSEARAYKKYVAEMLQKSSIRPLDGPINVFMAVYRPRRSGDLDNRQKVTLDACNKLLWNDDNQVVGLFALRYDDKDNPRVELTASED